MWSKPHQVSLIYAKADGNFNKEISMVRGNEVNEFSATTADVAGEEKENFYFTSVAETVYPSNTPDFSISFAGPGVFMDTPKIIGLAQNSPNLFKPSPRISCKLSAENRITLTIINLLGSSSQDSDL